MATIPGSPVRKPGTTKPMPTKIHFVVSARDLPMKKRGAVGATVQDPFVKISHKGKNKMADWVQFGATPHINNEPNPDWFDVFSFDWVEGSGQQWHFEVMDHDTLSKNDTIGFVDVNVDYYVLARNQELSIKLSCGGTLLIKGTRPISFRLSADDIPHLDPLGGKSDPYVECYWSSGKNGPLNLFGVTHIVKNVESADWGRFEFANYQEKTNQFWTFKVYDKDPLPKDDVIGECQIEVDQFVMRRATEIKQLSADPDNKATLTIQPASIY